MSAKLWGDPVQNVTRNLSWGFQGAMTRCSRKEGGQPWLQGSACAPEAKLPPQAPSLAGRYRCPPRQAGGVSGEQSLDKEADLDCVQDFAFHSKGSA